MDNHRFQFGLLTVVMLVALRLSIGCHFLYEGVWKIKNADEFSARPFLTEAKGPAAQFFYAMVPDLDGRQRLRVEKDDKGNPVVRGQMYAIAWDELTQRVIAKYGLSGESKTKAEQLGKQYQQSLRDYLEEKQADIIAYFGALDRLDEYRAAGNNGAAHQQKRIWDNQQKLRKEVGVWLADLDGMGEELRQGLWNIVLAGKKGNEIASAGSAPHAPVVATEALPFWLPFVQTRTELVDMAVTYGLAAIGLCMMLGLCNRLACLGGAVFLVFVLLTQPPWPSIYPPAPPVVGHALVVDKNFVEMVAMVMLATTPVGRWGGLDFFLHHWFGRRFDAFFNKNV